VVEDQRIVALKRAESRKNTRLIRQLIVGKNVPLRCQIASLDSSIKDLRSVAQHFAVVGPELVEHAAATDRLDQGIGDAYEAGRRQLATRCWHPELIRKFVYTIVQSLDCHFFV